MHSFQIFWPMLAVLSIPVVVILVNAIRKSADRKAGNNNPEQAINNKAWSLPVVLTSNSLENQFQFPIVFYALCFIILHIDAVSMFALVLCWVYAGLRWVHAIVHISSNNIPMRFGSFLASMIVLIALLGYTVGALAKTMESLPA